MRVFPLVLLAAAVAAVAGLLLVDLGGPAGRGAFPVTVATPEGELFNGTVAVDGATAYTVLVAAAREGGFDVHAIGQGASLFVVRIGAYENAGAAGWCFAVWDQEWVRPPHSAGIAGLQDGQAVRWDYEADGCDGLDA